MSLYGAMKRVKALEAADPIGPGWDKFCRDCHGVTVDWHGARRCVCKEPSPLVATYDPARVSQLLTRIGWTTGELADRAGINPRTVRRWAAGTSYPPSDVLNWLHWVANAVDRAGVCPGFVKRTDAAAKTGGGCG